MPLRLSSSSSYSISNQINLSFSGFKKLLSNRGYEGELTIHVAPNNNTPSTGPMCLENCKKCLSNAIIKNKSVIHATNGDSGGSDSSIEKSIANTTTSSTTAIAHDTIKTINGKFFMVNGANISCACVRSPNGFSKYCHLGDGYIDLVLVRHTSFINNIRFLLAMSSQSGNIVSVFFPFPNRY